MSRAHTTTMAVIGSAAVVGAIAALQYDLASLLPHETPAAKEVSRLVSPARPSGPAPSAETAISDLARELTRAPEAATAAFDVVRIDPNGASVLAGRAAPNAPVTVMANGQPVITVKANENGEWSAVTEHKFTAGRTELSLHAKAADQIKAMASQVVSVDIAESTRPVAGAPTPRAPVAPPTRVADAASAARGAGKPIKDVKPLPIAAGNQAVGGAPLPITFVYREATLTDDGRKSAQALADFLQQQKFEAITLTGHADERGTAQHNMDLSRQRLDSVAALLRQAGYAGRLVLIPKGESEPFAGVDRRSMDKEQLYQLDRRVELRLR